MKIMPNRLDRGFYMFQNEYEEKALEVLRSGWYVLGKEVSNFEEEFSNYVGAKYCVGLASGLDALWIAFRILGIGKGDEVIVQGNTYIASVMGITINGATPVFVEPDEYYNIDASKIEEKITDKTKAILVVHLYGQAANMQKIMEISKKYNLRVVEDCAQSHGACYDGKTTGTFGDIGCFSFYPSKNLGAYGDGGAIVTNDAEIANNVKIFRNYGSEKRYYNKVVGARTIQAGYKEAPIYVSGRVEDGIGGGICQITTTLYNAVVYANLDIVERSNHQFVPSYAGPSRDATVVYGAIDFKFKNNRNYPIKIACSVSGGIANFKIWGLKSDNDYEVQISSRTTGKTSTAIYSEAYKILKKNGSVVSTTLLSKDTYKRH